MEYKIHTLFYVFLLSVFYILYYGSWLSTIDETLEFLMLSEFRGIKFFVHTTHNDLLTSALSIVVCKIAMTIPITNCQLFVILQQKCLHVEFRIHEMKNKRWHITHNILNFDLHYNFIIMIIKIWLKKQNQLCCVKCSSKP